MVVTKFTVTVIMALAISYLANAAPINVTNGTSLCYCEASVPVDDDTENEAYGSLNDTLTTLHTFCDRPSLVGLF